MCRRSAQAWTADASHSACQAQGSSRSSSWTLIRPETVRQYQMKPLEIGTDKDHVHFLVRSVPTHGLTRLVTIIESLAAREIFRRCPDVRRRLWGGEFCTDGYFASIILTG